jgi:hypothetical protein
MNGLRLGLWGVASLAAMTVASAAQATVLIEDTVWIHGYTDDGPDTRPVSNSNSTYGHFRDQIGSAGAWNTYGVTVDRLGDDYRFKIYTNKDSNAEDGISGREIGYADFFIDLEPNDAITGDDPIVGNSNFSDWDLALDFQPAMVNGVEKYKLYRVTDSSDWLTSQDIFAGEDLIYGGLFRTANCDGGSQNDSGKTECPDVPLGPNGDGTGIRGFEAPTRVLTDAPGVEWLDAIDIQIDDAINDPVNVAQGWGAQNVISFSIAASHIKTTNFDLFWGTGECANDSVWGNADVPEPFALSLFGLGLAGAYLGVRRRRRTA